MKAHMGVDASSGLVHTVVTTAANEADVNIADEPLHGKEQTVHADVDHTGADKLYSKKGRVGHCGQARKNQEDDRRRAKRQTQRSRARQGRHPRQGRQLLEIKEQQQNKQPRVVVLLRSTCKGRERTEKRLKQIKPFTSQTGTTWAAGEDTKQTKKYLSVSCS
jgi:IS5 family transposase